MRPLPSAVLLTFAVLASACGPDVSSSAAAALEGQQDSLSGAAAADADGGSPGMGKVAVCHVPPGNPANAHTIVVGAPAVAAHLRHGDRLGTCAAQDGGAVGDGGSDGSSCQPEAAGCDALHPCCEGLACSEAGLCVVQID